MTPAIHDLQRQPPHAGEGRARPLATLLRKAPRFVRRATRRLRRGRIPARPRATIRRVSALFREQVRCRLVIPQLACYLRAENAIARTGQQGGQRVSNRRWK
jgi:hypothetical protein